MTHTGKGDHFGLYRVRLTQVKFRVDFIEHSLSDRLKRTGILYAGHP